MNLSLKNYFGPQAFTVRVRVQDDHSATRYGYESATGLYDVVVLAEPIICNDGVLVTRYYQSNGKVQQVPNKFHEEIEKHFHL